MYLERRPRSPGQRRRAADHLPPAVRESSDRRSPSRSSLLHPELAAPLGPRGDARASTRARPRESASSEAPPSRTLYPGTVPRGRASRDHRRAPARPSRWGEYGTSTERVRASSPDGRKPPRPGRSARTRAGPAKTSGKALSTFLRTTLLGRTLASPRLFQRPR